MFRCNHNPIGIGNVFRNVVFVIEDKFIVPKLVHYMVFEFIEIVEQLPIACIQSLQAAFRVCFEDHHVHRIGSHVGWNEVYILGGKDNGDVVMTELGT